MSYPIIIIGGGPIGLITSVALSHLQIPHLLLEKHPATAIFPKAVGLNQRTIEYLRSLGLQDEIYRAAAPPDSVSQTTWYTSLGPGPEGREIFSRDAWGGGRFGGEYARMSPCQYTMLPQIRLEPILHATARELNPGVVRNNVVVVGVEDGEQRVRVRVRCNGQSTDETIDAQYVIAADGGRFITNAL